MPRKSSVQRYRSLPKHLQKKVDPDRYRLEHPFSDPMLWKIIILAPTMLGLFVVGLTLMVSSERGSWGVLIGLIMFSLFMLGAFVIFVKVVSKVFGGAVDVVEELEESGALERIAREYRKKHSGDKYDIL